MKNWKYCALVALILPIVFASCSDDDVSAPSTGGSVIITTDNGEKVLLKYIEDSSEDERFLFNYDNASRCTAMYYRDQLQYSISYNPYELTYVDEDDSDNYVFVPTFNSAGYVTKLAISNYSESGAQIGTGTLNFSYDKDGHMTKMSGNYGEHSGYESWSFTVNMLLTWESGNLTKIEESDGEKNITVTFKYGNKKNQYQQPIMAMIDFLDLDFEEIEKLAFIGYFGKWTAYLPSSVMEEISENGYTYTDADNFSYTLYSGGSYDGLVKSEKCYGYNYSYYYTTQD